MYFRHPKSENISLTKLTRTFIQQEVLVYASSQLLLFPASKSMFSTNLNYTGGTVTAVSCSL